ncbi:tryptophan synthase subunit alpha [Candidatus Woesearchaeota archaeon]|nr:tryptophan synthase subunit alpha [Candidatus Woesearchaeota archaeon]
MSRYKKTFKKLKKNKEKALVPFVVAGDPNYKLSLEIIKTIINAGADILELGFTFSEPIADGPTIQTAGVRALKAGVNTDRNFNFAKQIRKINDKIPIGLLTYTNLIYQRGIDKFYKDAANAGVDSVLVADLPIEEADPYIKAARKAKVDTIFIVSPLTDNKRLKKIASKTKGFVYVVSRLGVTGAREKLETSTLKLLKRIRPKTKLPLCVGFGIKKPEHIKALLKAGADGAIVGSAVVKIIEKNLKNKRIMLKKIENYIKLMKNATK